MADITLSSGSIARPFRSPWGSHPIRQMRPISTNAAIHQGQVVTLDWTANSTNVGQIIPSSGPNFFFNVGLACSSVSTGSSGTANGVIPVWEANPMCEFVAYTKGAALASSVIGLRKKLMWDSTLNIQYVDLTASTATDWRVIVTGMGGVNGVTGLNGTLGDTGGQVTFRFISHLTDNTGSSVAETSTSPVLAFFG